MMASLRKWLLAGLLVIVPLGITAAVLQWVIRLLDQTLQILPAAWQPEKLLGFYFPGIGALLAVVIVLAVGAAASNFFGRRLVSWSNHILSRIPVVRSIYTSVKQVSDTLFAPNGNAFRTAVMVQWPLEGMWTIGFVTGSPSGEVAEHVNRDGNGDHISVYIPTTPNPTSGYFMLVPKANCIELKMNVDEALKYIVSLGVVVPGAKSAPAKSVVKP